MATSRAIFVSSIFPGPSEVAQGSYNLSQLRALRSAGLSFEVLATRAWFPLLRSRYRRAAPASTTEIDGFRVSYPRVLYAPLSRGAVNGWLYAMSLRGVLRRTYTRVEPRFVWSSFVFPDGVGVGRLAREAGLPHVVSIVGSDLNLNLDRPARMAAIRRCLAEAQLVLAKSRALRDAALSCGIPGDRMFVEYNGVDTDLFRPRSRTEACALLGESADVRRVLYVGNLVPVKNVPVLLAAFERLAGRWKGEWLDLVIVGDGFQRQALLDSIGRSPVGGQVRLVGAQPSAVVADWMAASDVLCLPSSAEGVPNVVLEALASGRPVVASAVGGIPEVHPGSEAGALVPAGDAEALASALEAVLRRRWTPELLVRLVEGFSWDGNATRIVSRLVELGLADRPR